MGIGVAQNLAQTGHQVLLLDVSDAILDHAKQEIRKNIRFQGLFQKSEQADSPDEILQRIQVSTDYQLLKSAEFVIENTTEKWEVKKNVYPKIYYENDKFKIATLTLFVSMNLCLKFWISQSNSSNLSYDWLSICYVWMNFNFLGLSFHQSWSKFKRR